MHTRRATWILAVVSTLIGCGSDPDPASTGSGSGSTSDATSTSGSGGPGGSGTGGEGTAGEGAGGKPPSFEGYTRVDAGTGTAVAGGADLAIAPDGTIWVSWVDLQNGMKDVFVAASKDGGKTFGKAVKVDDAATEPLVSMARHP